MFWFGHPWLPSTLLLHQKTSLFDVGGSWGYVTHVLVISVDEGSLPQQSISHLYLVLYSYAGHYLLCGHKIHEQRFLDTDDRIPQLLMLMSHTHKEGWSELLRSKLAS